MKYSGPALAALLLGTAPASAQLVVADPVSHALGLEGLVKDALQIAKQVEMINNQIEQLVQLRNTFAAVSHGNISALGDLVPELGTPGLISPLGEDMADVFRAASGAALALGATGSLTQDLLRTDQFHAPSGADFRAVLMNQTASALASQKALAALALSSNGERLTHLAALRSRLGASADVKDAADAAARLAGEQATAQAQGNQLLALQIMQTAQAATAMAREQQAWRCTAEALVARAKAAAGSANTGTVTLINNDAAVTCATNSTAAMASITPRSAGIFSGGSSVAGSGVDDGSALSKMLSRSWGQTAANRAAALGVNPTALAAACVLESNCNAGAGGTGTISGPFQMTDGTYAQTVRDVAASSPGLAGQINGKADPASQAIAAAQYLKSGAISLQASGIANPTVLDTRGYYNFGPAYGAQLASAPGNQLMSDALNGMSAAALRANGIGDMMTVGQWRAGVTNKIGAAAAQPVLMGSTRA